MSSKTKTKITYTAEIDKAAGRSSPAIPFPPLPVYISGGTIAVTQIAARRVHIPPQQH